MILETVRCCSFRPGWIGLAWVLTPLCVVPAVAGTLADSISVSGDSISRAFDADTGDCNYGDNVSRNWATGDDHSPSFCSAGPDNTFSHAERLECAKLGNISNFNHSESGATMLGDFFNQASGIRTSLSSAAQPGLINVFLGHNDACTNFVDKTGNSCGGDRDPNNHCRTTNAAFEREFRRGMDQLIQVPNARIAVLATVRASQLCNFESKNGCGVSLGLPCDVIWGLGGLVGDLFGSAGICSSLTSNCSNQRIRDMYTTLVGYNEILERVTNEYAAIPIGGVSPGGATKAVGVEIIYRDGTFYFKLRSSDVSCCDCFHPSDSGQRELAESGWNGLDCSTTNQCCGQTTDTLAAGRCSVIDTWSSYPGSFWEDGVVCGNGIIDPGEQCDDGNSENGDCCSASCQFNAVGHPCTDDGNACTADECDGSGTCLHIAANGLACDDGLFCNGSDVCSGGTCTAHSGDPCLNGGECADTCDEDADSCNLPAGVDCSDDGNICTDDVCDGGGECAHVNNSASCDDGVFCNGDDVCGDGVCQHSGDPCATGSDCQDACNEAGQHCIDPAGAACSSDGNACTDDVCDGSGVCAHLNNTADCDDGDACTTGDFCAAGTCVGGAPRVCDACQMCDSVSGCSGSTCTPTPAPTQTPTETYTPSSTPVPTATFTPLGGPLVCPDVARSGCRFVGRSILVVKDSVDDGRDKLLWKMTRAESTVSGEFGNPMASTYFGFCLYDANGRVLRAVVPSSLTYWRFSGGGFKYKNSLLSDDGIKIVRLKSSDRDRTKILLKAIGSNVPDFDLGSITTPLRAQLTSNESLSCWEAVYGAAEILRNDESRLKAKSRVP